MKILVLSDSHGKLKNIYTAIDFFINEISCIVHLGDFFDDAKKIYNKYPDIPIFYVAGNNDFSETKTEAVFNCLNKKIFITHGHFYNVYFGNSKLFYRAKEVGADICLCGHTHNPFIEQVEDVFILNPGSVSYPRLLTTPTFALLDISNDKVSAKFFALNKDSISEINIL